MQMRSPDLLSCVLASSSIVLSNNCHLILFVLNRHNGQQISLIENCFSIKKLQQNAIKTCSSIPSGRSLNDSINSTVLMSLTVAKPLHALGFNLIPIPHSRTYFSPPPRFHCNLLFMAIRNLTVSHSNLHLALRLSRKPPFESRDCSREICSRNSLR